MEPLTIIPNLIEQVHLRLVDAIADGTLAQVQQSGDERVRDFFARRGHAELSRGPTVLGRLQGGSG